MCPYRSRPVRALTVAAPEELVCEIRRATDVRFGSLADIGAQIAMSAILPIADIDQGALNVRFVPITDLRMTALSR